MAEDLVKSVRQLGWEILASLHADETPTNGITLSSLSITIALAMLAGAAGSEQKAILCAKMGISNPIDLSKTFENMLQALQVKEGSDLKIANKAFVDDTIAVRNDFVDFLRSMSADLATYPDLSKQAETINAWVSEHTHKIIKKIVDDNVLRKAEVVLVNAIAFKGSWVKAFQRQATTRNHPFLTTQNQNKSVDMMFLSKTKVLLAGHDKYTAIRLPYKQAQPNQPQIYFEAYLPNPDVSLDEILTLLTTELVPVFQQTELARLGLPKFESQTSQDVTLLLSQLGYPLTGDFSGMIANKSYSLSSAVIHKAAIKVDEEGTVAVAATAIIARRSIRKQEDRSVIFERAFAYAIADDTGMTYFTGLFT